MTNEELVALIQAGDRDRLPELWEQVKKFVGMMAGKLARNLRGNCGVTAEDLYQSGYIALVKSVDTYEPDSNSSFINWLYYNLRTVFADTAGYRNRRQEKDLLRHAGRIDIPVKPGHGETITITDTIPDPHAVQDFQDVEDRIWLEQLRAALDTALAELPADQAELLRRHYYDGESLSHIGACAGVTPTTACRWKQKALKPLRRREDLRQFL